MPPITTDSTLVERAQAIMRGVDAARVDEFVKIVEFSNAHPSLAAKVGSRATPPAFGSEAHLTALARKYVKGREPKPLKLPRTVPDPALAAVLMHGYHVQEDAVGVQVEGHRLAMVAENVIGGMLERFIDAQLGEDDWVWCAGETVRSVDFVRATETGWESLQVKNRDNSENSSSAAIRVGTNIQKWHRTISLTGETCWDEFPVAPDGLELSEDAFQEYIKDQLQLLPDVYAGLQNNA